MSATSSVWLLVFVVLALCCGCKSGGASTIPGSSVIGKWKVDGLPLTLDLRVDKTFAGYPNPTEGGNVEPGVE
ncbi:MAG TPA: hypothetical protein VGL56_17165 [Fimbriimonadaceae bacterium]